MATENMLLNLPTPLPSATATPGPLFAIQNTDAFLKVDSHNHQIRRGVLVPSAGIFINADLDFHDLNATQLRSARYQQQVSALALADDLNCLYSVAGDMWFNDGNAVQIQITKDAALNTDSIGSIGGDYIGSDASVYYTNVSKRFFFTQDTLEAALMDMGALTIRAVGTSANGVTLTAPAALAGSYALTFPDTLPASTKMARLSSSGVVTDTLDVDNSTVEVSMSNALQLKDLGITAAKIADGAVVAGKVATNIQTGSDTGNQSTGGTAMTAVPNLSQSITTAGGPVVVMLESASTTDPACYGKGGNSATWLEIRRGGTVITHEFSVEGSATTKIPASSFEFFDAGVIDSPGSYTYDVYVRTFSPSQTAPFLYLRMRLYEEIFVGS